MSDHRLAVHAAPTLAAALCAAATVALAPTMATAAPAAPAGAAPDDPAISHAGSAGDHVVVEELTAQGVVISSRAFDASGNQVIVQPNGVLVPVPGTSGSGSGGSSSASGCRRIKVRNEVETLLGDTAYWYITWTQWCWDRAAHEASGVETGQYFEDVNSFFYYRGLANQDERFYAWQSGYNKSGFWHERQSAWENCVVKYGCISMTYPRNVLRSHADGTYTWTTSD